MNSPTNQLIDHSRQPNVSLKLDAMDAADGAGGVVAAGVDGVAVSTDEIRPPGITKKTARKTTPSSSCKDNERKA